MGGQNVLVLVLFVAVLLPFFSQTLADISQPRVNRWGQAHTNLVAPCESLKGHLLVGGQNVLVVVLLPFFSLTLANVSQPSR